MLVRFQTDQKHTVKEIQNNKRKKYIRSETKLICVLHSCLKRRQNWQWQTNKHDVLTNRRSTVVINAQQITHRRKRRNTNAAAYVGERVGGNTNTAFVEEQFYKAGREKQIKRSYLSRSWHDHRQNRRMSCGVAFNVCSFRRTHSALSTCLSTPDSEWKKQNVNQCPSWLEFYCLLLLL